MKYFFCFESLILAGKKRGPFLLFLRVPNTCFTQLSMMTFPLWHQKITTLIELLLESATKVSFQFPSKTLKSTMSTPIHDSGPLTTRLCAR